MSAVETRTVSPDEAELRLDRWFKRHYPGLAFGHLAKLLRTGQVRVDGKRARAGQRLHPGQEIRVPPLAPEPVAPSPTPPAVPSDGDLRMLREAVLYKDDLVLAVNKPAGLATQGGTRLTRHLDAMLDALRFDAAERPRLVHRLDKDTSGVLLLGRSAAAASRLSRAFRSKDAVKLYWALTAGTPKPPAGRMDLPLAKLKRGGGEKMGHDPEGKPALTLYRTIATAPPGVAWQALSPKTGRTHQLRAHMMLLGTPILGDGKYGGRTAFPELLGVDRLHLHARRIILPHPGDGTTLRITAPLPAHMAATFEALGFAPEQGEDVMPVDSGA